MFKRVVWRVTTLRSTTGTQKCFIFNGLGLFAGNVKSCLSFHNFSLIACCTTIEPIIYSKIIVIAVDVYQKDIKLNLNGGKMKFFWSLVFGFFGQTDWYEKVNFSLQENYCILLCPINWCEAFSFSRHILAISHFNENLNRETQRTADGEEMMRVTWPKYKLGEESVRRVPVPPTYGNWSCF